MCTNMCLHAYCLWINGRPTEFDSFAFVFHLFVRLCFHATIASAQLIENCFVTREQN